MPTTKEPLISDETNQMN